jgi:hydroxymethylbilane synthase
MTRLVVATRKSALALAQARAFMTELRRVHPGLELEELHVTTTGDRIVDRPLCDIGGKGLFVKEIEEAILSGTADLAIHSLKDVPPVLARGLVIGCVPKREDPRDALVSRSGARLQELPAGSRVGTSSLRRSVQLRAFRPDFEIVPLRGNVDTRLRKCASGDVDAIILARAGLARLGLLGRITETISENQSIPAVGQGALGIEFRGEDARLRELLAPVADLETQIAVAAERGVMSAVEGNCQTPVAAFARRVASDMRIDAMLAEPDGSRLCRRERVLPWPSSVEDAERAGFELGRELRAGVAQNSPQN